MKTTGFMSPVTFKQQQGDENNRVQVPGFMSPVTSPRNPIKSMLKWNPMNLDWSDESGFPMNWKLHFKTIYEDPYLRWNISNDFSFWENVKVKWSNIMPSISYDIV